MSANISFKVKEYSIKVFVPLGFSVDENELEVIFPDVSIGIKNVIKNNNLIGCNYILGTENEDSFINLMSRYKTFIKSAEEVEDEESDSESESKDESDSESEEEEHKVPCKGKHKQSYASLLQARLIKLMNEEYKPAYAVDVTEMTLGFEIETEFEDNPKKLEVDDWRRVIFHATELASGRDFSIENANKLKLPSDELVKLMNDYFY